MAEFWIDEKKGEAVVRAWDKLTLGGITFPGICQLECNVGLDMEVAKFLEKLAAGTNPAQYKITLTDKGYVPGRVKALIQIWTKDQWEDMEETLPKFSPRSGSKQGSSIGGTSNNPSANRTNAAGRDAFDIVHPATALLGIDSVTVTNIVVPPVMGQTMFVQMDMIQYFPATGHRRLHSSGGALNPKDFAVDGVKPGNNL